MEYLAQELWHGHIYPSLQIKTRRDKDRYTTNIVLLCQKGLAGIIALLNAEQFSSTEVVENRGTHVAFPKLRITDKSVNVTCRIRIHPCWFYPDRERKHFSKIFVILSTNSLQTSENLLAMFNTLQTLSQKIGSKVKKIVDKITDGGLQESQHEIIIRNIGMPVNPESDVNLLFKSETETNYLTALKKSTDSINVIGDILSLHYNKKIADPIKEFNDSNLHWRVIRCNPNLLYGMEGTTERSKFTGVVGITENFISNNVVSDEVLHFLFKSRVIQIINSL